MRNKIVFILGSAVVLILASVTLTFSQESAVSEETSPKTQEEFGTQWLWGEVVSIDTLNKTLLVKYLDYELGQEKEITIIIDEKTTYEDVKSIDEIVPAATVSVDYIVGPDGKNIAKNISVEALESSKAPQKESTEENPKPVLPIPEAPGL